MFNQNGLHNRRIRIEVTLFKSVDNDTRRWRRDLDLWVGDTVLRKRHEDFARRFAIRCVTTNGNFAQEDTSGMSDAD